MIKIGLILKQDKDTLTNLPPVWKDSNWSSVQRDNKEYAKIVSFDKYWTTEVINQFPLVFETDQEYEVWLQSTNIVPTFEIVRDMSNQTIGDITYQRKCDVLSMPEVDFKKNVLKLKLAVRYYLNNVEQKQHYKEIELRATNDNQIAPNVGEYDYIINRLTNENIEIVTQQMVDLRIADGTIDNKIINI